MDILEKLYKEISIIENLEFYYKYLVEVNFGAIQYLSGNKDSVVSLSNLQKECAARQEKYLEAHVKCLIESFAQAEEDSLWYNTALENPQMNHSKCWKYYGRKYLFGELEFWSES